MTTTPVPSAGALRSRLDPEPMPRRDFLGMAATWTAASALLFALVGSLRLPKAAVLPSPSKRSKVAVPDSLAPGMALTPAGRSFALFKDGEGVYAISTVCTHLGCIVRAESDGFHCPCHGSRFAPDGTVVKGPAPKPLPWLAVRREAAGIYLVDEGTVVPAGTKETA